MRHRSRHVLATGAVLAAATSVVVTTAPPAQAATTTHCSTSTSFALLPTGQGYLFPNLRAPAAGCDFVDNGAPYHFTVDTATTTVFTGGGQTQSYTVKNLQTECASAGMGNGYVGAYGCHVPGTAHKR
ncbi:hypothetical protein [Streptomyces spectabilis]|uniref:Uncharacterized protein n=1 Tax=Streptomyces spectabilis TaxID=68270 RepID=A0A5P2WZ42_STRST|nr:hypothetical protein [Streptomyces spectabilis]MBB5107893.1 hypothetical protein [Streptomyces spectabilis]MCI3899773.1 hypothetical protein [Streptomyces spectabilis]QEV57441.1 hypothetical protein CP982_00730 [Streptomyces spectabilis]GGV51924.1 hypothetical protein GCM10010245_81670 [Streptomyces spectabilis]